MSPKRSVKLKKKAAKEAAKTSSLWRDEPIKTASLGVVSTSETLAFGQLGMITQADFKLKPKMKRRQPMLKRRMMTKNMFMILPYTALSVLKMLPNR